MIPVSSSTCRSKQGPAVGGDVAAVEGSQDLAGAEAGKVQQRGVLPWEFELRLGPRLVPIGDAARLAAAGFSALLAVTLCRHRVSLDWSCRCLSHNYLRPIGHPMLIVR